MNDALRPEDRFLLSPDDSFPPVDTALDDPNGLLAIGGELTVPRLLDAYRHGIFPWFSDDDPVLWWSPDPRMVLFPDELRVSKSLQKRLRRHDFEVTFDKAFDQVIAACAVTPRGEDHPGTWITEEILEGYSALYDLGYAHSVETWIDDEMVGGLYGVQIGKMYYGESMFHRVTDASKIAFVHLVRHLAAQGVGMIDCQMNTSHLASFGAREIPRREFLEKLHKLTG